MTTTHWALAAMAAVSLCFSAPALAGHEKGHHGHMGKAGHHCQKGCDMECCKKGEGCDKEKGCDRKGCDWKKGAKKECPVSEEKRKLVREAMKNAHEKNKDGWKGMKARHQALKATLSAKDFDRAAFLKAFDDMAAARAAMGRNKAEAFADIAPQFTPEEREKMSMFLAGGMHHGKKMRGKHGCPYAGKGHMRKGPHCNKGGKKWGGRHHARPDGGMEVAPRRHDWDGLNR